jgi:tetratricopeptide (TPR) repeat protein
MPYKNALTCVTCHNPHVSVKVTGAETFNNACKNCHDGDKNKVTSVVCTEKMNVRELKNDNCVSCHMPRSGTIDIPHVTSTDHYIRKPVSKKEIEGIKTWLGIKCINNENPATPVIAKAYLNYYEKFSKTPAALDSAKKYLPDETNENFRQNFSSLIRYHYIKEEFDKIIAAVNRLITIANNNQQEVLQTLSNKSLDNDNAWTSYRIGEAFRNIGDPQNAYTYFNNAVALAPYDLDFRNKTGASLVQLNRVGEAKKIFADILKDDPEYVPAMSNLGFIILAAEHDVAKSGELYDKALALDPDYEQALLNKAGWYAYNNQLPQARQLLHQVLRKHPDNKEATAALKRLGE